MNIISLHHQSVHGRSRYIHLHSKKGLAPDNSGAFFFILMVD